MRFPLLLPLTALFACSDSGGSTPTPDASTSPDGAGEPDSSVQPDASVDDPGPEFVAMGPAAGYHWFWDPAPQDAPNTRCNVGGPNSWNFYADTWQLQSPNPTIKGFAIALQATPGGSLGCTYTLDGRFTCTNHIYSVDLQQLPVNLQATVTMTTSASGRFLELPGTDPANQDFHLYSARYAAQLDLVFSATCAGSQCAQAASAFGTATFPCTSTFSGLESVNYTDPTLSMPSQM
ncbi:MAG: hypothetical protein SFX73_02115 [Kofleriaceae bacterium]|nr:hypothetical protein [Kofleriaceae bacterium]